MAKKEYVLAKKDIESLMHEKCACKFCDPESDSYSDWKTVWKQAFDVQNLYGKKDGQTTLIDWRPSDQAETILADCYERIERAVKIAQEINTVEFFDYLLGKVNISKNFKTYSWTHVWSEKKFFSISAKKYKKHFTDRLLVALVNIAPEGSQAYQARENIDYYTSTRGEMSLLSFAGGGFFNPDDGIRACVIDFKHINNFSKIEKLKLLRLKDWKNGRELKKLRKLTHLTIDGSSHNPDWDASVSISKIETLITEELPIIDKLRYIYINSILNKDLSFLSKNKKLEFLELRGCPNIITLECIQNMLHLKEIQISSCENLEDISALLKCTNLEKIIIYSGCNKIDPDIKSGYPITLDTPKKINQYLN